MANRLRIDLRGADDYSAFPFINETFIRFAFDFEKELNDIQCFFKIKNNKSKYFIIANLKEKKEVVYKKLFQNSIIEKLEIEKENVFFRGNKLILFSEVW